MSAPMPTSFLGGPFLVNTLHRLPIPLVDAIFNQPSTLNHILSPPVLFNTGIFTLSQVVRRILLESFPDLPVEALNHLVSESTSASSLAELISRWGLRYRALQLSAPSPEREEEVFVRIVGGIKLHQDGDAEVYEFLGVVLGDTVRELKVELETNGEDRVRSLFVKRHPESMPERGSSGEGTSHEASSDVPPPRQLFRSMEGNVARPGTDDAKDATGEHVSTTSSVIPSSNRSAQDPSTSSSCHHEKTTGMEIVDSVANLSLPQLSSSIDSAPSVNPAHNLEPNVQLLRSILDRLPPTLLETIFTHRSFDAEDNYDNLNMYTPSSMEKALENIIQQRYPELSSSDKSILLALSTQVDVLRTIGTDWSFSSRILSFEVVGEDTLAEVVEALVNGITSWLGWVDAIAWCKSAFSSYISSYKAQLVRSPKVTQLEALTKQRGIVVAWTDLPSTSGMVGKVFVVEARAGTKSAVGRGSRLDIAKEAAATSLLQSGALDRAGDDESKRPESPPAAEVPASKILEPERVVGLPSEEEGEGEGADAVSTTTSKSPSHLPKPIEVVAAFVPNSEPLPPSATSQSSTSPTSSSKELSFEPQANSKKKKSVPIVPSSLRSSLLSDKPQPSPNVDTSTEPSPLRPPKSKPKSRSTSAANSTPSRSTNDDPRKRLFELSARLGLGVPSFQSRTRVDATGVEAFVEKVLVGDQSERGTGWTKEAAQQKACRKMLESGRLGGGRDEGIEE